MRRTLFLVSFLFFLCLVRGAVVDTSQWQFRVTSGIPGVSGLLQMRPTISADWGGVCGANFDDFDAAAGCYSIGAPIPDTYTAGHFVSPMVAGAKMYLGGMSCPSAHVPVQNCTFTFVPNGSACDPSQAAAIDCRFGTLPATQAPSYTFFAVFQPTVQYTLNGFQTEFTDELDQWYHIDSTRVVILAAQQSGTQFWVRFQIGDRTLADQTAKEFVQEHLVGDSNVIWGTNLNLVSINTTMPTPAPAPTYDVQNWKFRQSGGAAKGQGRLEVFTTEANAWGTVCGTGFGDAEAYAACGSLGYINPPWAFPVPDFGGGSGLIALDNLVCGHGEIYLTQCSFNLYTPTNQNSICLHTQDAGVDCYHNTTAPPDTVPVTYSPAYFTPQIGWQATISVDDFHLQFHLAAMSQELHIPVDRIQVVSVVTSSDFVYLTFTFLTAGPLDPPRVVYDTELEQFDPSALSDFEFQELINNVTGPILTLSPSQLQHWNVSLSEGTRGLIRVKPSTSPAWGTVCDAGFGVESALALCLQAGVTATTAAPIPHYNPNGQGTIYLDQLQCSPGSTNIDHCAKRVSTPDNILNNCTHLQDEGVVCFNTTTVVPSNPNTNVSIFTVSAISSRLDLATVHAALVQYFAFSDIRLVLISAAFDQGKGVTSVQFYVTDIPPNSNTPEPPRTAIEYWLQHIDPTAYSRLFGWLSVTWAYGNPPVAQVPATHSLAGWKFSLNTGGKSGLLLAKPPGESNWGGVCGQGFTEEDAVAVCRTMGFDTDFAVPTTTGDDTPIFVADISCPLPLSATETLAVCNFTAWNSTNLNLNCARNHAVSVDCLPDDTSSNPVNYTAVVKTAGYTRTGFAHMIADDYNISDQRVVVFNETSDGIYSFVQFYFADDSTVTANDTHVTKAPSPNATTAPAGATSQNGFGSSRSYGSFAGSIGANGFGSVQGKIPLHGAPRELLDYVTTKLITPTVLFEAWGIYELRLSTERPNGRTNTDPTTWAMRLVNYVNNTVVAISHYGRVDLQLGAPNAPWGTVSGIGFNHFAALVVCRDMVGDHSISTALAIPYFIDYRPNGIIYLSDVSCPSTSTNFLGNCSYQLSTRYHKTNNATHNNDVGVICGPVPSSPRIITYGLVYDPNVVPLAVTSKVQSTLANVIGIPVSRIVVDRYFDNWNLKVVVSLNFTEAPVNSGQPSRGACDLFLQSINTWGLFELFGAESLQYNTSVIPDHSAPPSAIPPPPTTASPTTAAPPTTHSPSTAATTTTTATVTTRSPATTTMQPSTNVAPTTTSHAATTTTTTTSTTAAAATTTSSTATTPAPATTPATTSSVTPPSTTGTTKAPQTSAATTSAVASTTTSAVTSTTTGSPTTTHLAPTTTKAPPTQTGTGGPSTTTTVASPSPITTTPTSTTTQQTSTAPSTEHASSLPSTTPIATASSSAPTTATTATTAANPSPTFSGAPATTTTASPSGASPSSVSPSPTTNATLTTLAPPPPVTNGPPTTTLSPPTPPPATTIDPALVLYVTFPSSMTAADIINNIHATVGIPSRDITVGSITTDANGQITAQLVFLNHAEQEATISAASNSTKKDQMGITAMSAPDASPSSPSSSSSNIPIIAGAIAGVVVIGVAAIVLYLKSSSKTGPKYDESYVQMQERA